MSVRAHAVATGVSEPPTPQAAATERRVNILPPGERERRRGRQDRRRADRRVQDLGAPYGADRRSGQDDRQADRRGKASRPAGIGLMRDYFSPGPGAPGAAVSTPALAHDVVRNHD
jgi:hypothetical protein